MMDREQMLEALRDVQAGRMAPETALQLLARAPYEDIGYAKIDHHRSLRNGTGEVIYGAGKTAEQIVAIASHMVAAGGSNILVTRMDGEKAARVAEEVPLFYDAQARVGVVNRMPRDLVGSVVVASGGTSDLPVCEEAALTAQTLGSRVTRLYDVGVAGLHRLLSNMDALPGGGGRGGHGGRAGQRDRRAGGLPRDRGAHLRGLWRQLRRRVGAAVHAERLRRRHIGGQHRQRLRRGLPGQSNQSDEGN